MKIKREDVSVFEKLTAQLSSSHQEITALSKKTPNGPLNVFKLKLINDVLVRCNALFGEEYRPFAEFSTFSLDDLPTNSDVSFILSQYLECAEKFRADRVVASRTGGWLWDTIDEEELVAGEDEEGDDEEQEEEEEEEEEGDDEEEDYEEEGVRKPVLEPLRTAPPRKLTHK